MELVLLIVAMVVVGLLVGWIAGFIWKDKHPIGVQGDYVTAVITAVVVGLIAWFVIPAMGFSPGIRNLGVTMEPALGALLVLWLVRVAKR
ncbi:MAG: hypothetical protein L6461_11170 [Anaerolineae bacterium]|nr:hypothetical protein [Anaerolineae bacterium]